MSVAIGIDVGGTAIKGGIISSSGEVLEKTSVATEADRGVDHLIDRMVGLIQQMERAASQRSTSVTAVGLGVPGNVDSARGVIDSSPNLDGWKNIPIVARVAGATGLRVVLDNDANAAALGEYVRGAGQGVRDMVLLTLGTGVGSGLILDGKLWHGAQGRAGEIGHMLVRTGGRRCGCGQKGCLEAYASSAQTGKRAAEAIQEGESSSLKTAMDHGGTISSKHVVEAAAQGDALARRVWDDTCQYLAIACVNIQHLLSPERIVFAGGMSAAGESLLGPIQEWIGRMASKEFGTPPTVCLARLGNDAGFIGAGLTVFQGL